MSAQAAPPAALMLLEEREAKKWQLMAGEVADIVARATEAPIATEKHAHALVGLMTRGSAAHKELEASRKQAVKPLNDQTRSINGLYATLTDPLVDLLEKGKRLVLAWQQQERARIAREQAEAHRKQVEAAEREALAMAAAQAATDEQTRRAAMVQAEQASRDQAVAVIEEPRSAPRGIRTDSGSLSSTSRYVLLGIQDLDLVPARYWRHEKVVAALEMVIRAAIRAGERDVPGCSVGIEESTRVTSGR